MLGGSQAADVVLLRRHIKHGHVAEDETEFKEPLRGGAIVIVAFSRAVGGARRAVADAAEGRALERHRMRKPPLGGRTEVEGRARNAEDLRRNVVVGPEEAPHPAIRVACSIRRADKKAPDDDVLEGVGGGCSELKIEVIEWAAVAIAGLPGQPIGQLEICDRLILFEVRGGWAGQVRIQGRAELKSRGDSRSMAREHGVEPVAEHEAVEAGRWRERRCAQLSPEPGRAAVILEQQAGHPEERFPQETSRDRSRDLVVDGGRPGLAPSSQRRLPTEAYPNNSQKLGPVDRGNP